MATTMLHEVGHCALGLDHPTRFWRFATSGLYTSMSFTRSWNVKNAVDAIDDGGVNGDHVRGSWDDHQTPIAGTGEVVQTGAWFRKSDNNPVVVDSTIIDKDTYSRLLGDLATSGSTFAANANRVVAEHVGHRETQSVMHPSTPRLTMFHSLSADDVNMLALARTGKDSDYLMPSSNPDDYTVLLAVVPCAQAHHVEVLYRPISDGSDNAAQCWSWADYAVPGESAATTRNFKLVPDTRQIPPNISAPYPTMITIEVNSNLLDSNGNSAWITEIPLFSDGFETLDTVVWSASVP